jgi:hypothetical protein
LTTISSSSTIVDGPKRAWDVYVTVQGYLIIWAQDMGGDHGK